MKTKVDPSLLSFQDELAQMGVEDLRAKCLELQQSLTDHKDYCNALFVLVRDFLPICPSKSRAMWERALEQGWELKGKYKQDLETELLTLYRLVNVVQGADFRDLRNFLSEMSRDHQVIPDDGIEHLDVTAPAFIHLSGCIGCRARAIFKQITTTIGEMESILAELPKTSRMQPLVPGKPGDSVGSSQSGPAETAV